jgi:hypothetical protein
VSKFGEPAFAMSAMMKLKGGREPQMFAHLG